MRFLVSALILTILAGTIGFLALIDLSIKKKLGPEYRRDRSIA